MPTSKFVLLSADGSWRWSPPGRIRVSVAEPCTHAAVLSAAAHAARLPVQEWLLSLDGSSPIANDARLEDGCALHLVRPSAKQREEEEAARTAAREMARLHAEKAAAGRKAAEELAAERREAAPPLEPAVALAAALSLGTDIEVVRGIRAGDNPVMKPYDNGSCSWWCDAQQPSCERRSRCDPATRQYLGVRWANRWAGGSADMCEKCVVANSKLALLLGGAPVQREPSGGKYEFL